MSLKLNTKYITSFIGEEELFSIEDEVYKAHDALNAGTGFGSDFLGWMNLPVDYDKEEYKRIKKAAAEISAVSDVFVVIGIGGSYLGARAVIEFIKSQNYNFLRKGAPEIYFTGNTISSDSLNELIEIIGDRDFSLNIISKSGTTTEPAVAFRVLKAMLENKYGKEGASRRIYATTDAHRGTLKQLADAEGYETFVVPDNVGGRYSVLTAVGLLPIAVAGIDTDALLAGAASALEPANYRNLLENDCYKYAAYRNLLYRKGKKIELFVSYEPCFTMMNEWYKQLFGESEGKENKGLFPASVVFSTDLHSMGQYIQEGERTLFETVVSFAHPNCDFTIPYQEDNSDGLNFLSDKSLDYVNKMACQGTVLAHTDGDVPNLIIEVDRKDEYNLGCLIYFLEKACAVSGYLLGVNPFNQPGVEAYKKNMFALLGKPGYEDLKSDLLAKLG